jgi:protein ImuB
MFACLFLPSSLVAAPAEADVLEAVGRAFSPRVEVHGPNLVTLDISGLGRLLGSPGDIGRELLRDSRERGCAADIAIASTRTAAMLLALACDGLTIVPPGDERRILATLPLGILSRLPGVSAGNRNGTRTAEKGGRTDTLPVLDLFRRWGLKTLGDVAALPAAALSERIGQEGLRWQRAARGEDLEPLVAAPPEVPVEERLDLEWPVDGLEPLSFLLPRLLEPICERLERLDQAAVALDLSFRLATREQETRRLQLPAPMRDAKVLRTLILLHLESHPLGAGVDRLAILVETAPARVLQFSLLARAMPFPEQMATLLARLGALMGERRVGAAALVDSHRPGAFAMRPFSPTEKAEGGRREADGSRFLPPSASPLPPSLILRRFRLPVPARVMEQDGRPVRVTTERRGLEGGRVESAAGPWRTSGEWWQVGTTAGSGQQAAGSESTGNGKRETEAAPVSSHGGQPSRLSDPPSRPSPPWNRDEWDVALSDGAVYRLCRDRATERWFVEGIVD